QRATPTQACTTSCRPAGIDTHSGSATTQRMRLRRPVLTGTAGRHHQPCGGSAVPARTAGTSAQEECHLPWLHCSELITGQQVPASHYGSGCLSSGCCFGPGGGCCFNVVTSASISTLASRSRGKGRPARRNQ